MTDLNAEGSAPADEALQPEAIAEGQDQAASTEALPGDDAAAAAETEAAEQAKQRKSAQDRIGELTKRMREAERRAEEAERRAQAAPPPPQPQPSKMPNPADYADGQFDPQYVQDLATHIADETVGRRLAAEHERQQQDAVSRQMADRQRTWEDRKAKAMLEMPDFAEVVDASVAAHEWPCPPAMAQAIETSEMGPKVAYHLAKNPDEARRIAALDQFSQVREIGRLEAKLELAPKTQPKTVSGAPAPPANQARGAGGQFKVAPDTDDFEAFDKTY